jgi:universal stress protein A
MRIQKILVPIDFSEGSRAALRHAVFLAERFAATIETLHVWEPAPYVTPDQVAWMREGPGSLWKHIVSGLERDLGELVATETRGSKVPITKRVAAGYVGDSIVRYITDQQHDLVVMGTHGRTGLRHVLIGSVAERVVRLSPVPVMTIRVPLTVEKKAARARDDARRAADEAERAQATRGGEVR